VDETLLLKVAIAVLGLVVLGIALTVYEFREHIIERFKKRRGKK